MNGLPTTMRAALALLVVAAPLACCTDGKREPATSTATSSARDSNDDPLTLLVGDGPGDVVVIAGPYEVSKPRQELLVQQLARALPESEPPAEPWALQVFNLPSSSPRAHLLPPPGQRLIVRTMQREFRDRDPSLSPKQGVGQIWLTMQGPRESVQVPDGASIKVLLVMDRGLQVAQVAGATTVTPDGVIELKPRVFKRGDYEAFVNDPTPAKLK